MIEKYRAYLAGGIRFDDWTRRCIIDDNAYAFGTLFTGFGIFSVYILFFRPDIHKEVNALIWIFRVIFPFGFGLAGLALLGQSKHTVFDARRRIFIHVRRSLFKTVIRKGRLDEVTRIVLDARQETGMSRGDTGRDRMQWRLTLSMDLAGELIPLREWRRTIEGNRAQNEAVVKAQEEAERMVHLIDRPLELGWMKATSSRILNQADRVQSALTDRSDPTDPTHGTGPAP